MLRLVMKKITLILLFIAIITSCQVPTGGNAIQVSGKNFTVASTGGDVDITTDGAAECTLTEPDKQISDFVRLHLFEAQPVTHTGTWYSFESRNDGKELHLKFEENSTSNDRILYVTLTEADEYARITITQNGSKQNNS